MAPTPSLLKQLCKNAFSFAFLLSPTTALNISSSIAVNGSSPITDGITTSYYQPTDVAPLPLLDSRSLPVGIDLALLAVGDSITAGVRSSDENSYRLDLRRLLEAGNYNDHSTTLCPC
jgi:lysophospholipase L1-like esterase